ncbi:MAG: Ig-like domain repeat protein [Frankiaceae bacterium]|nr:Ig-like domain repeat protein [Frankiaceae bacterium]
MTGGATDETIATYMGDFPNTDTSTPGYVDAFQLRVKTSTDGTYQSLDFVVSGITKDGDGTVTGGTWTQTYPGASPTATTTALAVSRTTATTADEVTLTATTGGGGTHPAGSVQFSDNGGNLGAAVAVNGSGVATLVQKLPAGSNVIKATFTPTDSSFASSSSSTKTVTVTKARINNLKHPKLKGKHKVGEPEKVKPGKWSPKPTKFKFKWYLDGKKIKGAKQKTYTPTKKDKGGKLSCKVTAKRAGYKSGKATTKAVKIKK